MTGKIDSAYMAEVERMTAARERDWEREIRAAQSALAKSAKNAEKQRAIAARSKTKRERALAARREAVLWEMVELRRVELDALLRVMQASPASSAHRGVRSFGKVPIVHGALL